MKSTGIQMVAPKVWAGLVITATLLCAALWIILSQQYGSDEVKWAYGILGTLVGYWLPTK